jgi:hypothetical protein
LPPCLSFFPSSFPAPHTDCTWREQPAFLSSQSVSLGSIPYTFDPWEASSNEHSVRVHPVDPSSSSILFYVSIYLVQHIRSFVNDPAGDTIFDPGLGLLPRWAVATFYALYGGVVVYMNVDMLDHVTTLVRRIVLWHPTLQWPPLSNCPWTSTSIADVHSFCWHQFSGTCSSSTQSAPGHYWTRSG